MSDSKDAVRVTYHLTCAPGEDGPAKARDIALEQTAEMPRNTVPPDLRVVGEVEVVEHVADGRWRAVIAYQPLTVGDDFAQLLNLLFGNVSLKSGILVSDVDLPATLVARFTGPALGIPGLRALCGTARRPMICTSIKPMGLSSRRLADLVYRFARGGIDVLKDDHGVTNQDAAPFAERVVQCQEAVSRANAETGGRTLYFPNVTAGPRAILERVEVARRAGCRGVLVLPLLTGLDAVRELAATSGLAVFAHPALAGALFRDDHGIRPEVLLGRIFRLAGSDGVIYPNQGGRFPWGEAASRAINEQLRAPWHGVRPAFPVAGGGVDAARVAEWTERYGPDTIFLIGSSLYAQGDVERAAARVMDVVRRYET